MKSSCSMSYKISLLLLLVFNMFSYQDKEIRSFHECIVYMFSSFFLSFSSTGLDSVLRLQICRLCSGDCFDKRIVTFGSSLVYVIEYIEIYTKQMLLIRKCFVWVVACPSSASFRLLCLLKLTNYVDLSVYKIYVYVFLLQKLQGFFH